MSDEQVTFTSKGLKLVGNIQVPAGVAPGEKRPAFIVLHGFGSTRHAGNVKQPCALFDKLGYVTMRFDMPGCGDSEGPRGRLICLDQVQATSDALTTLAKHPAVDGARIIAADGEPQNWLAHGRTYGEQRYSPLAQINAGNVEKLGLASSMLETCAAKGVARTAHIAMSRAMRTCPLPLPTLLRTLLIIMLSPGTALLGQLVDRTGRCFEATVRSNHPAIRRSAEQSPVVVDAGLGV